jgi:hypothetical protein
MELKPGSHGVVVDLCWRTASSDGLHGCLDAFTAGPGLGGSLGGPCRQRSVNGQGSDAHFPGRPGDRAELQGDKEEPEVVGEGSGWAWAGNKDPSEFTT